MSNSQSLTQILEKILQFTSIDPSIVPNLRAGLRLDEIKDKLKNFPLEIPKSLIELFQWHDGIEGDIELFHYHTFISLGESLEVRNTWNECNTPDQIVYKPDLLPIFGFEGEYYCIQCSDTQQDDAPIWFVYHDHYQVYDSLRTMMLSILECYEVKAYTPVLADGYIRTEVNKQRVAEIKLKHNPSRVKMFDYLAARGGSYEHP